MPRPNRRTLRLTPLLLLLAVCLPASASLAQDNSGQKATVELLVPKKSVKPGETIDVGVKMTMQPGWHIYWKNPGDSGQPPRFSFSTPGGGAASMLRGSKWTASDVTFPTPVRWTDAGGLVGYGYGGTVVFPATLTVPGSATPGQAADFAVTVDYLICKDVCIPESGSASVNLEVGLDAGGSPDAEEKAAAKEIEQAKQRLPAEASAAPAVSRQGDVVTVKMKAPAGAKNVAFFPELPANLSVEDVQVETKSGEVTARFRLRPLAGQAVGATSFPAVIGYDTASGERRGTAVSIPLEETKP